MFEAQSVSQCLSEIKKSLEGNFSSLTVIGEVSNLSLSSGGHWYFTLSDSESSLSSALFKGDAMRNSLIRQLRDGDKVICVGGLSVYQRRGTFQLICRQIIRAGKGDLKEQFELLKKKLAIEGLFDPQSKKKISLFPKSIAIITALHGAALQDFLNIYRRRALFYRIVVVPATVQGERASLSIRNALEQAIRFHLTMRPLDVIVLARGGGSLEDLWCFNDEALAYDIFNSPVPTLSAVGHQVDFTICDFVADLRAETPSAAAEILTSSQLELSNRFRHLTQRLGNCLSQILSPKSRQLNRLNPARVLHQISQRISQLSRALHHFELLVKTDQLVSLSEKNLYLDDLLRRILATGEQQFDDWERRLERCRELLQALGPSQVLQRGFSYIVQQNGTLISSYDKFSQAIDPEMTIVFSDGEGKVQRI